VKPEKYKELEHDVVGLSFALARHQNAFKTANEQGLSGYGWKPHKKLI
jgi:hypothetical protein